MIVLSGKEGTCFQRFQKLKDKALRNAWIAAVMNKDDPQDLEHTSGTVAKFLLVNNPSHLNPEALRAACRLLNENANQLTFFYSWLLDQ